MSPSVSRYSRKLVCISDANWLWEKQQSFCASGVVEEKPVLLVSIQESWCSRLVAKRGAVTPVSGLSTEVTGLESQA